MLYKGLRNPSYLCIDNNPVLLWVLGIVRCLQLNDWWCHHLHLELISAAECQKTNHLLVDHSHPPICTSPSHKATCVYCWLYHSFPQRRMPNHVLLRCTWPWHANPFPSLVQCSWLLPTMELYDTHCSSPPPDHRPHPHWDPCMTSLHQHTPLGFLDHHIWTFTCCSTPHRPRLYGLHLTWHHPLSTCFYLPFHLLIIYCTTHSNKSCM